MADNPAQEPFLEPDSKRRARFPRVPIRYLIPNLITLLSICAGLTAVRLGIEGKLNLALFAVVIAAVLDGLDGRVARMLKGTSKFGAELDSLCDFVNFGVVPALLLYQFSLREFGNIGWIACLLFAMAMALRLARFNVMLDDPDKPEFSKDFFTGIPAPAGALCCLLPIYLHLSGLPRFPGLMTIELLYMVLIGAMLVSRIPTFSGKRIGLRVPREYVLPLLLVVILFVVVLVSYPFETLAVITLTYLGLIPYSILRYRELEKAHAKHIGSAPQAEIKVDKA